MNWSLRLIFVFVVLLTIRSTAFSQGLTQIDRDIVPPSPTAFELGKYGFSPVSMYSGTASYSIPLYELSGKSLSLPISLSYYSNGIKVDQVATSVGMGWSLNAGGAITRIVRGSYDGMDTFHIPLRDDLTTLSLTDQSDYVRNHIDSEPDLFAYNFAGHSGKFIINKADTTAYTIPYENIKIKNIANYKFEITTEDGNIYTFDKTELTTQNYSCAPINFRENFNLTYTAYFLSRIKNPIGDSINLTYANDTIIYTAGLDQTITNRIPTPYYPIPFNQLCSSYASISCSSFFGQAVPCQKQYTIYSKILTGITYGNIAIKFNSTKSRLDVPSSRKMDNMIINDSNTGEILKSYSFNYTFSTNNSRMFLSSIVLNGAGSSPGNTYSFNYDNINDLPPRLSYAQDHWGYYNGVTNNSGITPITTEDSNSFNQLSLGVTLSQLFSVSIDREPHYPYSQKGILTKITYPTGGTTTIEYESNCYYNNSVKVDVGGLRILRTTTKESATSPSQIEHFYYTDDLNNLNKSTAYKPVKPRYFSINVISGNCNWSPLNPCNFTVEPVGCSYVNLSSSSLNNIYQCSGNNIAYEGVVKSFGDNFENGGELYNYLYRTDINGSSVPFSSQLMNPRYQYYVNRPVDDALNLAPKTNFSWNAGTLIGKTSFKKNASGQFIILHKESYGYNDQTLDSRNSKNITGYWIRKFSDEITSGYTYQQIYQYDVVKYITYSIWGYLSGKTETTYDVNGLNPVITTTNYYYENAAHAQLTREEATDSKGNLIRKKIYYPADCLSTALNFGTLNTRHILNIPVDIRKYVNSKLSAGQQIKYNNLGQTTDIYMAETNGAEVAFVPSNPYTFKHKATYLYDPITNNLNQQTKDNNFPTTYLWSYNNTLPVAKIENATYTQVSNSLTSSVITTLGLTNTQALVKSQLTQIRDTINAKIPSARVHNYTYSPLTGMKSQTDPNGLTTTYEYDSFGRLTNVKDKDQYILSRNYYHYYSDSSSDAATLNVSTNMFNIAYTPYSASFAVTANCPWTTSSNASWLTATPSSGSFSGTVNVSATVNPGTSRVGTITVTYGNSQTKTVTYTQASNGSTLSVNVAYLAMGRYPDYFYVNVSSNTSWTITLSPFLYWLTVTPSTGGTNNLQLSLQPQKLTTGTRTGTVTLKTADGAVTVVITVFQDSSIF